MDQVKIYTVYYTVTLGKGRLGKVRLGKVSIG